MDGDAMSNALRTGRPGTVGTAAVKPQALQQTQPQQRSNIGNFAALKAAAEEIHAASKEGRDPDPRILAAAESAPLKPNQQPPIVPVASPADLLQKPPDAAMISAPKEPKPLPAADIAPAQSRLFGAPKPAPAAPTPPPQDTKPAYTLEDSGKVEPFVPLKPEKMMPDDPGDPQPRQAADLPFATSAREDANAIIDDKSLAAAFKPVAPKPKGVLPGQMDITEYVTDEEERAKPVKVYPDYNPPPIDLLAQSDTFSSVIGDEETDKARLLEECLANFKCPGHVVAIVKGPAVTRYEYKLDPGINVNAVARVKDTIAYNLQTTGNVHVEAPIPGKQAIGIEVPNDKVGIVSLRSVIDSDKFYASTKPLTYALGKDIAGEIIISNLPALVHLLVAGTTGSGKSSGLNCVLVSLVYKYSPEDMRLVLIDPKKVEFVNYNGMPHLLIEKAIVDTQAAIRALNWAADEVDRRFTLFNKARVRNIDEYNRLDDVVAKKRNKLPYIVCVVDELAQLIDDNKQEVEACLRRLTALARAAGVHLIIATQRPSTEVINGVIKANVPSVMAFATKSDIDSRVITGENGCEDLLGRGDMLFYPQGAPSATRVQGAYVDTAEVNAVVEYLIANNEADFDPEIERLVNTEPKSFASEDEDDEDDGPREFVPDKLFMEALRLFIDKNDASITMIQRRFGVGYNKAARVIDQMEQMNLISEKDQTNKRKVLITLEDYLTRFGDYL
ncbi:MAG: DNA translocase FtsK, partial [Clostridiales bacterium]|jgi:S-DNA-T family DNA segregation ATPase FtsK/SpoIIIE|nr:DNA translocase FtsK [Clostridiales bacterium]